MSTTSSILDLKTTGMVAMKYPPDLRAHVLAMVDLWKQFCELPVEMKQKLQYSNRGPGTGYEFKDGVGKNADRKENLDISASDLQWAMEHAADIADPIARQFVQSAAGLADLLKPTAMEFAQQSDRAFGLEGFTDEVRQSTDKFFFRFIHYFGDRELGEETAAAHVDQSGFTFHLYESAPGLQCLTYDRKWVPMPVSEGETVVIPSMQMQLRSNSALRALCHRVIATPETQEAGRYSVVCFVQLKNTPKYDKDRCGRLQEREPGFNYEMPPEKFAELFKAA